MDKFNVGQPNRPAPKSYYGFIQLDGPVAAVSVFSAASEMLVNIIFLRWVGATLALYERAVIVRQLSFFIACTLRPSVGGPRDDDDDGA